MRVKEFLKNVSEQIMRLNEIEPQIPDIVIKLYNIKFKNEPETISKPECTNGLAEIKIFLEEQPSELPIELPPVIELPPPIELSRTSKKPVFH